MSLLEIVCKELGVEIGEEWLGNDGKTYIIEKESIIEYYEPVNYNNPDSEDYASWVLSGYEVYADILQGRLKPTTKPKHGATYYTPDIFVKDLCLVERWENRDIDYRYLKRGLVFETEEEAVAMATKIIEFIGGEVDEISR